MQITQSFDKETIGKIFRGALIAGGGVAIVYLLEALAQLNFGVYTPVMVGIFSILINAFKEWLKGTAK